MAGGVSSRIVAALLLSAAHAACAAPAAATGDPAPDLWTRDALGGSLGGLRPWLAQFGVTLGANEQADLLGNPVGGRRAAVDLEGVATLSLDIQPIALPALHVHVSALQLHGRNLTSDTLGALQAASGIESEPATRLWEAWAEWTRGAVALRAGKMALDQEFLISSGASVFLNASMGWPVVPTATFYAGGPAYPLAVTGARLRVTQGAWTGLLAVADDNPTGGDFARAAPALDPSGTRFALHDAVLAMGEVQYARASAHWPASVKVGGWVDDGAFPDRRDAPTPAPASARMHRGDAGVYAVVDQTLPQFGGRTPAVFVRVVSAPQEDRNLVTFGVNAGLTVAAPFAGRPGDTLGLGAGLARLGSHAYALERDRLRSGQSVGRISRHETFVELTYQARVAPWWSVQPDLQVIVDPDGAQFGTVGGLTPGRDRHADSALVLGARTQVIF